MTMTEAQTAKAMAPEGNRLVCVKCVTRIKPGQLYVKRGRAEMGGAVIYGPVHVACPTERQIAHDERMGRDV